MDCSRSLTGGAAVALAAVAHDECREAPVGGLEGHLADREDRVLKAGRDHGKIAGVFRPQSETRAHRQ